MTDTNIKNVNEEVISAEELMKKFDKDSKKPIYSIDTPPPTVNGKIHIGHIFSYSQAEFIARYKE